MRYGYYLGSVSNGLVVQMGQHVYHVSTSTKNMQISINFS